MTRAVPALALSLALAGTPVSAQVQASLPPRPWSRVRHLALAASCVGPLLPRPGGGAAAMLGAPAGVALIERDGTASASWRIETPWNDGAWWVGRELLHVVRGRDQLVAYAVDGTVRGSASLVDAPLGGVAVDFSRGSIVSFGSASNAVGLSVAWDATARGVYSSRSGWRPASSAPALDRDGGVWMAAGAGLLRVYPTERRVPLVRGVRRLVRRAAGGLFALAEGEVFALDAEARTVGRAGVDATVIDAAPRADGGLTLLLQTSPPSVLVIDAVASRVARFEVPRDARALTPSEDGAVLVATRDGEMSVHERDGTLRWRMSLPGTIRPPVVALSPLRYAVATEHAEAVILELAEPPQP